MPGIDDLKASKFYAAYDRPGRRSLKYQLTQARRKTTEFRNLSPQNIRTITDTIKPSEYLIRKKGGLSFYQAKALRHKLYEEYLKTRGRDDDSAFTKADWDDSKKIIKKLGVDEQRKLLKKAGASAPAEKKSRPIIYRRPYLEDETSRSRGAVSVGRLPRRSPTIDTGIAHGTISVNQMITGKRGLPPPLHKGQSSSRPPSIPLTS